ncbi:MAG: hypothetical protein K0S38_8 [Candidatus Paceibacter sp.]|jgi:hypothetical protein|nr:hypothetical protein [Candidatus Paceibacter sp.]
MNQSQKKLKAQIESRLQFVITILVFFLALIPNATLPGGILVALYVFIYFLFAWHENLLLEKHLHFVNKSVLLSIASFILPITVLSISYTGVTPTWLAGLTMKSLMFLSMWALVLIPFFVLLYIAFQLTINDFKKTMHELKK